MNVAELQQKLIGLGQKIKADGSYGPKTMAAVLAVMTDGTDDKLTESDVKDAATVLKIEPAKIWAVRDVEASASPFIDGRPAILFEPHVFSRMTGHKYDSNNPDISSLKWNKKLYPGSQSGRWSQLLKAIGLDVDAGLSSASYGAFQILGANFKVCNHKTPWDFVYSQSRDERSQLLAFMGFVEGNGLTKALQKGDWAAFAKGYNGSAYRENKYDERLAAAYAKRLK
jgi:hypothetical protein